MISVPFRCDTFFLNRTSCHFFFEISPANFISQQMCGKFRPIFIRWNLLGIDPNRKIERKKLIRKKRWGFRGKWQKMMSYRIRKSWETCEGPREWTKWFNSTADVCFDKNVVSFWKKQGSIKNEKRCQTDASFLYMLFCFRF